MLAVIRQVIGSIASVEKMRVMEKYYYELRVDVVTDDMVPDEEMRRARQQMDKRIQEYDDARDHLVQRTSSEAASTAQSLREIFGE